MQPQKLINKEQLPLSTHARSQSRVAQMGSQLGHCKGDTIDWATAVCHACILRSHGPQSHHPCYRQIKAIISRHHECFPHFEEIFFLDWPIFRRQKSHVLSCFYLLFYLVAFISACCSHRGDNILRNKLSVGITGHLGLLKDIIMSFVLSLSIYFSF